MSKINIIILCLLLSTNIQSQGVALVTSVADAYPTISPNGKTVLFHSNRTGKAALFTIDTSGTNLKQLTTGKYNEETGKWSPDGTKIVFSGIADDDESEVYVMNADGSNIQRLTFTKGDDSHPNWSPDGKKIIFNSARNTPDINAPWGKQHIEIFEMNADGSSPRQITHNKTVSTYPSYSPDGKSICYRMVTDSPAFQWDFTLGMRNSEVFVSDINGNNTINLTKNASFDGWPAWSPDGKYIAFASNRKGPANVGSLFIIKPDGTGLKHIISGTYGYAQPAWTPDGKFIYAFMNSEHSNEFGFVVRIPFSE